MENSLTKIKSLIYDRCAFEVSDYSIEPESLEYAACRFIVNKQKVICRNAKITPKKNGQFVTFWKRVHDGPIEPFQHSDDFDFLLVNCSQAENLGQFVFPKSVLIEKGIISTPKKEGKRAFRVYPTWDEATSKQALRTQNWQLNYFYEVNANTSLSRVRALYSKP
jgi:hypothetical protein